MTNVSFLCGVSELCGETVIGAEWLMATERYTWRLQDRAAVRNWLVKRSAVRGRSLPAESNVVVQRDRLASSEESPCNDELCTSALEQ